MFLKRENLMVKDLMVDLEKGNRAKEVLAESRKQSKEIDSEMANNMFINMAQQMNEAMGRQVMQSRLGLTRYFGER